jgi:hypothetical protein
VREGKFVNPARAVFSASGPKAQKFCAAFLKAAALLNPVGNLTSSPIL